MRLKERNMAYDVIRVVALMMIVMVHVSAYMVIFFPDTSKPEWTVGNLFNGVARAGVPMFIMLSGALLLREDKPFNTKSFYKKSLLTMGLLTIGWLAAYGIFYSVVLPLCEGTEVKISNFWGYLLSFKGSNYPHLWYMLMVVGMYLMIPVLRLFVKRENKPYIIGIIVSCIVFQFFAATADFFTRDASVQISSVLGKFRMEPVTGFLGFLLLGWYLNEYKLQKKTRFVLWGAGLAMAAISTILVYNMIESVPNIRDFMFEATTLPAFLYGAALFSFIQFLFKEKTTKGKLLCVISDSSFGIYLIHVLVMELFVRLILPYESFGTGKPLTYIFVSYAFTLLVSFAVVYLAGKVKGVRRIFYNR